MKVLIAHNRYRSTQPSGENQVVEEELSLLPSHGVDVVPMISDSDRLFDKRSTRSLLEAAVGPIYAPTEVRRFKELLHGERPDVVHVHNLFPLISPFIIREAFKRGVPVVQTVHNYRHTCVKGLHYRNGHECLDCLGHRVGFPGILHACYRDSRLQTTPMVLGQAAHRRSWDMVTRFLCVSKFQADRFIQQVRPQGNVVVKPNSVPDTGDPSPLGRDVVFVGRLSEEKGVSMLIDAWTAMPHLSAARLLIAGDGPLFSSLHDRTKDDRSVDLVGAMPHGDIRGILDRASLVVVPSVWNETFGRVVIEAFAAGRPVVVTANGALPELVDDKVGWVASPDTASLRATLETALSSTTLRQKGVAARSRYDQTYRPEIIVSALIRQYRDVVNAA